MMATLTAFALATGCATAPRPGDPGYAFNVDGAYAGRLVVEGERFDAGLSLGTLPNGRVRGAFSVRDPLEIDGSVDGALVDDLLRLRLTYDGAGRSASGLPCESRIEGILTVSSGADVLDGPVTIYDCGDPLPGRMSFRRAPDF